MMEVSFRPRIGVGCVEVGDGVALRALHDGVCGLDAERFRDKCEVFIA